MWKEDGLSWFCESTQSKRILRQLFDLNEGERKTKAVIQIAKDWGREKSNQWNKTKNAIRELDRVEGE